MAEATKHFILVHGACHGAWCWHRVKPLLEAAGYRVTVVDLAASGVNPKKLEALRSLREYTEPLLELMASLPSNEKVILVGHSLGGLNLAVAMEDFPDKVSVGVFVTAFLPDTSHPPSYVLYQYFEEKWIDAAGGWLDSKFGKFGDPEQPLTSMLFGPNFMTSMLYQRCSIEGYPGKLTKSVELAKTLERPASMFMEELVMADKFSDARYGSVPHVFIVCDDDKAIPEKFQRWMIIVRDHGGTLTHAPLTHGLLITRLMSFMPSRFEHSTPGLYVSA